MRIAATILLTFATLFAVPSLLERLVAGVLFQPSPGVDLRPEELGIDASEVWIDTEDGVRIHGFFLPGKPEADRALLFLHGNAGNASHRLPNADELSRMGTDVLLLDYRGYGRSEGSPSEEGVYRDARAGLAYLLEERGVREERVLLFGRSLGGAVSIDLAQHRGLAGVIVESTFTRLSDMGRALLGPLGALAAGGGFDSISKIEALRAPLLAFHGDRDEIVPLELGRRLYERAPEPKAFEVIAGAGHNDTTLAGGRAYFERIRRFLDEVAPAGR